LVLANAVADPRIRRSPAPNSPPLAIWSGLRSSIRMRALRVSSMNTSAKSQPALIKIFKASAAIACQS